MQENKQERDLEKAIQAEDGMIRNEEEEDISHELDVLTDTPKEGKKMKSYCNEKKTERDILGDALSKTAQKRETSKGCKGKDEISQEKGGDYSEKETLQGGAGTKGGDRRSIDTSRTLRDRHEALD